MKIALDINSLFITICERPIESIQTIVILLVTYFFFVKIVNKNNKKGENVSNKPNIEKNNKTQISVVGNSNDIVVNNK